MSESLNDRKKYLRKEKRESRKNLKKSEQAFAAKNLLFRIQKLPEFYQAKKIAFYFASDGEISPHLIVQQLFRLNKESYFPVIQKNGSLVFRKYTTKNTLKNNRFHIPEPLPKNPSCSLNELDIIFLPLVAFDKKGNRLGMGGGFYDRTLESRSIKNALERPLLIGLAHQIQEVESLLTNTWDIPLDGIVTDKKYIRLKRGRK